MKTQVPAKPWKLRLFADHGQIQLVDESFADSFESAWTAQATADRLAVVDGGIAVGTHDTADVAVTIERLPAAPGAPDLKKDIEHMTEGSLSIPSGKLVAMGCTDYFPDAKRLAVGAGAYRVRVSHSGITKGKERIGVLLWPAKMGEPNVLKRWEPPPPKPKADWVAHPPQNPKKAIECARAGRLEIALPVLEEHADRGDVAASLALAQICAFRGDDEGVVKRGGALFENPKTYGAINPFQELGQLVGRAARRIAAKSRVDAEAALAPLVKKAGATLARESKLLEDVDRGVDEVGEEDASRRASFETWYAEAKTGKQFRGYPAKLLGHAFAIARNDRLEAVAMDLWNDPGFPRDPYSGFEAAVTVARWKAFRGREDEAWGLIEANLANWWPVFEYQIGPVELVYDRWLAPVLTRERCERILAIPRGPEATR